jgi:glyoxylase-like metal-dependent hydrolase (beta-lactamase superfamily II)
MHLTVEDSAWEALHTPGHASDHLCFRRLNDDGVLTGDLIVGEGTVVIAPPDGDMRAYVASLQRLQALHPRVLWPGHGSLISDAAGKIENYLEHRRARETQILQALEMVDDITPEALTQRLYTHIDVALLPVATRQVQAHLIKLATENRVRAEGDGRWTLISRERP